MGLLDFKLIENVNFNLGDIHFNGKREPWRVIGFFVSTVAVIILIFASYWEKDLPALIARIIQFVGIIALFVGMSLTAFAGQKPLK